MRRWCIEQRPVALPAAAVGQQVLDSERPLRFTKVLARQERSYEVVKQEHPTIDERNDRCRRDDLRYRPSWNNVSGVTGSGSAMLVMPSHQLIASPRSNTDNASPGTASRSRRPRTSPTVVTTAAVFTTSGSRATEHGMRARRPRDRLTGVGGHQDLPGGGEQALSR